MRTLGKWWRTVFLVWTQIKKCPKTVLFKECTYVQKDKNEKDEIIDPPADNEQTFFSYYFIEKPNYTVEIIEVRLNEINLERLQNKGEKLTSPEHDKDRAIQHEKRKGALPKIAFPAKNITSDAELSDDPSTIEDEKGTNPFYAKNVHIS